MNDQEMRAYIRGHVDGMLHLIRSHRPSITPGEIYDAIARELERRCRAVIDMQSQQQMGNKGPMSEGQ